MGPCGPKLPLFARSLSLFHGWLPFLLLWLVWRLGYDRRAFLGWTVLSALVLLVSYFLAPPPPPSAEHPSYAVNINYVHGLDDRHPQTLMPPLLWLGAMIVGYPIVFYLPAHLALRAWLRPARSSDNAGSGPPNDPTTAPADTTASTGDRMGVA